MWTAEFTLETIDIIYLIPRKVIVLKLSLDSSTLCVVRSNDTKIQVSVVVPHKVYDGLDLLVILQKHEHAIQEGNNESNALSSWTHF